MAVLYLFVVNQCPHHGDVAEKNTFFTEHLTVPASGYCVYCFRIEESGHAFEEEENEFLQRDTKENFNNLVPNQEQVTVALRL